MTALNKDKAQSEGKAVSGTHKSINL